MDEDTQIITLKVKLGTAWGAEIEVPVDFTLNDLHFAIQKLVDFDDDHLYKFYISKTEHNRNRYTFACDDGGCEISISALFPLPTKTFLFYLFDFGDCWLFKISATRKNLKPIEAEVEYPRLVKETGEKPVQYGD